MLWNTPVEPVKWIPAKCGLAKSTSVTIRASPFTTLITPAGKPAFLNTSTITFAEKTCEALGFQITTLPISAALVGKLPEIAVKLNGVTAYTKPSKGRYSTLFHTPSDELGWSLYILAINSTLKRKKSISSQAESISA